MRRHGARVPQRQFGFDIEIDDLHSEGFGKQAHLSSDVAVTGDSQHLAAGFVRSGRGLDPAAAMCGCVAERNAAQQQDHFGQHQLRHAAGVGKGGVENRDSAIAGGLEIHLICAYTEASNSSEPGRIFKYPRSHLRG